MTIGPERITRTLRIMWCARFWVEGRTVWDIVGGSSSRPPAWEAGHMRIDRGGEASGREEVEPVVEDPGGILRTRRSLRMELHRPHRQLPMHQPLHRPIMQMPMTHHELVGERVLVHRI